VDEYQNYEKALGALSEANRCLAKVTTPGDSIQHKRVLDNLNTRMAIVKRFVDIRRSEFSNAYSIRSCCVLIIMILNFSVICMKYVNNLVSLS
jgi:intraflagellar transport protein 140